MKLHPIVSFAALLGIFCLLPSVVAAQQEGEQEEQEAPVVQQRQEVEEVVVTGSRIRRDEFTSTSPITVITSETSALAGLLDAGEILQGSTVASGPANRRYVVGIRNGWRSWRPLCRVARSRRAANPGAGQWQTVGTVRHRRRDQFRGPERDSRVLHHPLRDSQGRRLVHIRRRRCGRRCKRHHRPSVSMAWSSTWRDLLRRHGGGEFISGDATWGRVGPDWAISFSGGYHQRQENGQKRAGLGLTATEDPASRIRIGNGVIDNTSPETGRALVLRVHLWPCWRLRRSVFYGTSPVSDELDPDQSIFLPTAAIRHPVFHDGA